MPKNKIDSELFEDVMKDLKTFREVSLENAKSILEESWTPRLERMLADQLQAEAEEDGDDEEEAPDLEDMENDDDEGGDDDEEPELDLDDEEEDEEEMDDDELEEITNFLAQFQEAVADDGRHTDTDRADDLSYGEPQHDGGHEDAPMLDMDGHEDGYNDMEDDSVHESLGIEEILEDLEEGIEEVDLEEQINKFMSDLSEEEGMDHDEDEDEMNEITQDDIDALLSEYGVTDVDRDPMSDPISVSGPYSEVTDDLMDDSDDYSEFDLGFEYGQMDIPDSNANLPDSTKVMREEDEISFSDLLREMEHEDEMDDSSYDEDEMDEGIVKENAELKEKLDKYRQAVEILRNQINEINLINSKLLYTNKLNDNFSLNTRQQKRVINAFDRASNIREVKLTYANIAENFNDGTDSETSSQKVNSLTESIDRSLNSSQKNNSTKPNSQILNENIDMKSRFQKLAGVQKNKRRKRRPKQR